MKIRKQYSTQSRIIELIKNMKELDSTINKGQTIIDLPHVEWVYPISLLPIVVYARHKNAFIRCTERSGDIRRYLRCIRFPLGTTRLVRVHKDFLPITQLACTGRHDVLTRYEDRIIEKVPIKYRNPFLTSLKYLTSELESNVREHAEVEDYWIFSQYWSATRTCEIAICDMGIGYKASYIDTPHEVAEHIDAIKNALEGKSSKYPKERGAGIPSLVRMFVDGYKGEMIIMSGDSLLYLRQNKSKAYKFNLICPGSFVGMRFRLKGINIYDYLW